MLSSLPIATWPVQYIVKSLNATHGLRISLVWRPGLLKNGRSGGRENLYVPVNGKVWDYLFAPRIWMGGNLPLSTKEANKNSNLC